MSAEAEAPKKMIRLQSSDGQQFRVEEAVAIQSVTIKNNMEDDFGDSCLPLPAIHSEVLEKVIQYWERHVPKETSSAFELDKLKAELKKWDDDFIKSKDRKELLQLLQAANFLYSQSLLDLITQEIARRIEDMPVEEVRQYFEIENDWTPEEEEKLRAESPWVHK